MLLQMKANSVIYLATVLLFLSCNSNEVDELNVKANYSLKGDTLEVEITNHSKSAIYIGNEMEVNCFKDSLIVLPDCIRPGDFNYNRIRPYSFVPPGLIKLPIGVSTLLKIRVYDDLCTTAKVKVVQVYDAPFADSIPTKTKSVQESYFSFEKRHSHLVVLSSKK